MLNKTNSIKIIQLIIAIGLISFLFTKIDINKIGLLIEHASSGYLYLAILLLICQLIVAAYRWLLVMRINGYSLPLWQCIGSFATSSLINLTLPVAIGGDLMRIWVASRNNVPSSVATGTVLSDRIINTAGLSAIIISILCLCTLFFFKTLYAIKVNIFALTFASILISAFAILLLIDPIIVRFKIRSPQALTPIIHLSRMNRKTLHRSSSLINLLSTILLGHCMLLGAMILLALGLHMSLSFPQALIGFSIALLFSAVPITPGGWGVRESTMVIALGQFQVSAESALGVSILYGISITLASVPASILWLIYKYPANKKIGTSINGMSE